MTDEELAVQNAEFKLLMEAEKIPLIEFNSGKYRLRRMDSRNIVIEQRVEQKELDKPQSKEWTARAYYGKLEHLVIGLIDLVTDDIPEAPTVLQQLILLSQKIDIFKKELLEEIRNQSEEK